MKKLFVLASAFAFAALAIPALASDPLIYEFGRIRWSRDTGRSESLPMICGDSYYVGVSVQVPGRKGADFDLRIEDGRDCRLRRATHDPKGFTEIEIENTGYCEIYIDKLDADGQAQGAFNISLSDAC